METLEERIAGAHAAGDRRLLEQLQGEYRTRDVFRVSGPPSLAQPVSGSLTQVDEELGITRGSAPTSDQRVTRICFDRGTRKQLEVAAWAQEDGREAGAFLFGYRDGNEVVIDDMTETGRAERAWDWIQFDIEAARALESWTRYPIIGTWHTHCRGTGDLSRTDMNAAFRHAKKQGGVDVSIVVTPHPELGWAAARLSGWVAQDEKITPCEIYDVVPA